MSNEQQRTPLYDVLRKYLEKTPTSFHVPGHKNGTVFPSIGRGLFENLLAIDVTEIEGLDDLHDPTGPISEAQQLVSSYYSTLASFFLVGGSTVGNLAMILAVCNVGDTVLVQRNCHKSVINGLKLAKVNPVFLNPTVDDAAKVAIGLSVETVKEAIEKYPHSKALLLTNPNYYGMTIAIKEMIEIAHQYNIPVLVDEAHGAHFGIGSGFPKSAIANGADIVIHSAHKTLPAMTMASYLHFNSYLVDKEKIRYYLQVLQSSSPSYPLMASLDLARYYLAQLSKQDVNMIINEINFFRNQLERIPQISVVQAVKGSYILDPLKITIQSQCSLSGFELQKLLNGVGIYTELADPYNVLFVMPLAHTAIKNEQTIAKIEHVLQKFEPVNRLNVKISNNSKKIKELALSYSDMTSLSVTKVPLKEAIGKIAAEDIIPYPPGIPLIIAGEQVSHEEVSQIETLVKTGARFQGGQLFLEEGMKVFN
ncbi:aminotransferase class I/II-fold pyridoxal phosphate-dependent enzyme [Anaerobacillus sp. MEB173]|uniref:aminotransferase class I/II-fold pyridoxal phosphate-dependent enzyme n=1 Tax=Anaerobacillus sp. MEB173 TaxID=3383345 RepID=UPI003F8ED613